jgi:rod shape determining protein RodA
MFDRRLLEQFDWGLLLLVLIISAGGLMVLYSAVMAGWQGTGLHHLFERQLIWLGGGFVIMTAVLFFDFRNLNKLNLIIYAGCVLLLTGVLLFGQSGGGSQRWLSFGGINIQPSELMKIALIISLASAYSTMVSPEGLNFRQLLRPAIICMIPVGLIVNQPDLGTGLMLLLIAGSMTLFVKVEKKVLLILGALSGCIIPVVWFFGLKAYQKTRILTFLDPDRDPLGTGYHIIQSKIAIGSGMITGKGFLQGTQNALSFLPEQHTDFILSVLAEEWGLAGCMVLLALYFLLICWGLNIAYNCRNLFGSILAFGITGMIFWQVFINVGMVMGLMPVVGMPLPLVSYGGSSVITNMVGFGILLNISMRRFYTS